MRRPVGLAVGLVLLLALHSCERGEPGPAVETVRSAATDPGGIALRRASWTRISPPGVFRVSPAWSPSGKRLVVSGRRGRGLFLLTRDGAAERVLDAAYRGPRRWLAGAGDVLCFGSGPTAQSLDVESGAVSSGCDEPPFDDERGQLVFQSGESRIYHHPRLGTITRLRSGEPAERIAEHGAWGVTVSPDGQRVAWSTGTLSWAALYVRELRDAGAQAVAVGTGAHAVWHPDSRRLLYTEVRSVQRVGGRTHITASELFLFDARTGVRRQLTHTPGVAELQPAVSPDGRQVVFADWRDGAIYVAPLGGRVSP